MISWLYRPRGKSYNDPGLLPFLLEIFLIPLFFGVMYSSIFLFLYLLIAFIIGVFYFNIRILIVGIVIIGIVVIAGFGWIIGEFFSGLLFSSNARLVGGILGAILFGVIAFGLNANAFSLIDSQKKITLDQIIKKDFIVYVGFIIGVPLLFWGIIFPGINPIAGILGPPQNLPDSCIGNCFIGQSAKDGYFNDQKITLNRVFYLKHPYTDPNHPNIDNWHNWDWILLDISLTNTGSDKLISYGRGEVLDELNNNNRNICFGREVELTDFQFSDIKPGETRRGNIACVIDPHAIRPLNFEYTFNHWYTAIPSGQTIIVSDSGHGKEAIFAIDKYIQIDYNSIKPSLKGEKPF